MTAPPPYPPTPPKKRAPRRSLVIALVLTSILGLAALAWLLGRVTERLDRAADEAVESLNDFMLVDSDTPSTHPHVTPIVVERPAVTPMLVERPEAHPIGQPAASGPFLLTVTQVEPYVPGPGELGAYGDIQQIAIAIRVTNTSSATVELNRYDLFVEDGVTERLPAFAYDTSYKQLRSDPVLKAGETFEGVIIFEVAENAPALYLVRRDPEQGEVAFATRQ